eukprot:gene13809-13930_t
MSQLNPFARPWTPNSHNVEAAKQEQPRSALCLSSSPPPCTQLDLDALPMQILSAVVSHVAAPKDICSCLQANRQLREAVGVGQTMLVLTEQQRHKLNNPLHAGLLDQLVLSAVKYMPGMVHCSLSALPLEPHHISSLLNGLPHLVTLDVSGARKLTPVVTQVLQKSRAQCSLQCLNLQRCFQLTPACLSELLMQSCGWSSCSTADNSSCMHPAGASNLQCIALSHLSLLAWPPVTPESATSSCPDPAPGEVPGLAASAAGPACQIDTESATSPSIDFAAAAFWAQLQHEVDRALLRLPSHSRLPGGMLSWWHPPASNLKQGSSLRVISLNNCSSLSVEGLMTLAVACPRLEYLMLGGSTFAAGWPSTSSVAGQAMGPAAAAAAVARREVYVPPQVAAAVGATDQEGAACGSTGEVPAALLQLADVLQLPSALPWEELSSCCAAQPAELGCCCSCSRGRAAVGIDDGENVEIRKRLMRYEPVASALLAAKWQALALAYTAVLLPQLKVIEVTFLPPGVRGWLRVALGRLREGQPTTAGSFSRGSPGKAAAAAALLKAGADPMMSNTAGETPLYIAALRGHLPVVQLLLRHMSAAGIDWTHSRLYGDAWTPLMAAAVANRVDVALCLLRTAQQEQQQGQSRTSCRTMYQAQGGAACFSEPWQLAGSSGGSGDAAHLVGVQRLLSAENRYGQTALHIAARKGCRELLQLLLCYGAGQVAMHVDASGDTPFDVARRYGHEGALHELMQQC